MPFTISHAAAALPLFRTRLSRSALVIGTMVPDIPVFTSFDYYALSHSAAGLALYNLPVGLVVWLFWTYVLRNPTFAFCPYPLRKALFCKTSTPHYFTVLLSLVVGAATHQIWDGFTHRSGFFVHYIPELLQDVGGYPLYSWLQFLCSIFGLGAIAYWLQKKWDRSQAFSRKLLVSFITVPVAVFSVAVFYAVQIRRLNDGIVFMYGVVITSTKIMVGCYLTSVIIYYLVCWFKQRNTQKSGTQNSTNEQPSPMSIVSKKIHFL